MKKSRAKSGNDLPAGWDLSRVRGVIDFYDSQTAEEEAEEITRLLDESDFKLMRIPVALVPQVEKLLDRSRSSSKPKKKGAPSTRKGRSHSARAA